MDFIMDFYVNYRDNYIAINEFLVDVSLGENKDGFHFNVTKDYFTPAFNYLKLDNDFHKLGCYKTDNILSYYTKHNATGDDWDPGVVKGNYPMYNGILHHTPHIIRGNLDEQSIIRGKIEDHCVYEQDGHNWIKIIENLPRVIHIELFGGGGAGGNTGLGNSSGNDFIAGGGGGSGYIHAYLDTEHTFYYTIGYAGQPSTEKAGTGGKGGTTSLYADGNYLNAICSAYGGEGGEGIWYDFWKGTQGGAGGEFGSYESFPRIYNNLKNYITIWGGLEGYPGCRGALVQRANENYFQGVVNKYSEDIKYAPQYQITPKEGYSSFEKVDPDFDHNGYNLHKIQTMCGSGGPSALCDGQTRIGGVYWSNANSARIREWDLTPYWTTINNGKTYYRSNTISTPFGGGGCGAHIDGWHVGSDFHSGEKGAPGSIIISY